MCVTNHQACTGCVYSFLFPGPIVLVRFGSKVQSYPNCSSKHGRHKKEDFVISVFTGVIKINNVEFGIFKENVIYIF
jgi:hypothetical protein